MVFLLMLSCVSLVAVEYEVMFTDETSKEGALGNPMVDRRKLGG